MNLTRVQKHSQLQYESASLQNYTSGREKTACIEERKFNRSKVVNE